MRPVAVPLLIALLVPAPARAFCGFFVSGADAELYNNASQVVLMRKGNRIVMTMSNNYQGPPEDFAMVVPVPVVLQKEDIIRHYWEGPVACKDPRYDQWGGPPNGGSQTQAATDLANAPRGKIKLAAVVRSKLPLLALPGKPVPQRKKK